MKKVFVGLAVLLVVLGAIVWRLYANLDVVVANIIKEVGAEVTRTSVAVSGVQLKLLDGRASVSGLKIANPAGFSDSDIFDLEQIAVTLDVESLKGGPIVIDELVVAQPRVFYEINKDGVSNLSALKKNIQSYAATGAQTSAEQQPAATGSESQAVKLIIRKLTFAGGHLSATSTLAPERKLETDLPAFQLNNIGQSTHGATGAQITGEVLDGLIKQATQAAGKVGADTLKDELQQKGKEALDEKLGGALKGILGK